MHFVSQPEHAVLGDKVYQMLKILWIKLQI